MKWTPLRGSDNSDAAIPDLPAERGRYLLYLGQPFIEDGPRWVHFSWLRESFAIRDYLAGRMTRQDADTTASDVWRAATKRIPAINDYYHSVDDVPWWTEALKEL